MKTQDAKTMTDEILGTEDGNLTNKEIQRVEDYDHILNVEQRRLSPKQETELDRIWNKVFR